MDKYVVIDTETGEEQEYFYLWIRGEESDKELCNYLTANDLANIIDAVADTLAEACDVTKEKLFEMILAETEEKHETEVEITLLEKAILESVYAHGFEWIARDEFGNELDVFEHKPHKSSSYWYADHGDIRELHIFKDDFQFIKWEDKEPVHIPTLLENAKIIEEGE